MNDYGKTLKALSRVKSLFEPRKYRDKRSVLNAVYFSPTRLTNLITLIVRHAQLIGLEAM
jgi:hypothetical protein